MALSLVNELRNAGSADVPSALNAKREPLVLQGNERDVPAPGKKDSDLESCRVTSPGILY